MLKIARLDDAFSVTTAKKKRKGEKGKAKIEKPKDVGHILDPRALLFCRRQSRDKRQELWGRECVGHFLVQKLKF